MSEEYEEYGRIKWSWEIQQDQAVEIKKLKAQLNNMESCYIQLKQINNEQSEIIHGHFTARQDMQKRIEKALVCVDQAKDGYYGFSGEGGDTDNLAKDIEKALRGANDINLTR